MSTLAGSNYTLMDFAKRRDPDGKIAKIAELLSQTNPVLDDMVFKEGNLPTGHRTTIRTGLPSVYWRQLNEGVPVSKSTTAQVTEGCGMLEAYSQVDKDAAELEGDLGAFRLSEASPFFEAMNQEMASTVIYGDASSAAEEYTGLAPRYSDLSAGNAQNIINAGGSASDNTSVWLVCWGEQTVHGIFPKGSKAGLMHEDLGLETVQDSSLGVSGSLMRAYRDHWQWKSGLVVKDWRYAVRIANIDVSNLVAKSSAADLVELMIKTTHRIPNLSLGRCAFYMNRTCFQMLDIQRRDDVISGGGLKFENVDGKPQYSFRGIPVKKVDAILDTEATVS